MMTGSSNIAEQQAAPSGEPGSLTDGPKDITEIYAVRWAQYYLYGSDVLEGEKDELEEEEFFPVSTWDIKKEREMADFLALIQEDQVNQTAAGAKPDNKEDGKKLPHAASRYQRDGERKGNYGLAGRTLVPGRTITNQVMCHYPVVAIGSRLVWDYRVAIGSC